MSRIGRISLGTIGTTLVAYVFLGLTRVTVCPSTMDASTVSVDVVKRGLLPHDLFGAAIPSAIQNGQYVNRPAHAQPNSAVSVYMVGRDADEVVRVNVKFGRASADRIEVLEGLKEGDKIVTSDMSAWDQYDRIRVK